ncbi:glycosyltransferase, partial [bacterium]|nr:glycosyltransferase [bacterium]
AYPDGFGAVRLAQKLGKPVVLTTRGTDVNEFCFRWPIRRMVRRALDGATRLVAVSGPLKQKMCSVGVPDDKVTVIPNGVDTAVFHPGDRAAARQALGLSPDDTVLLSAGTLVEKKGFQHLIAGLGMAPAPPAARFYIAGRGPFLPALEQAVARAGVADRVTLLGHLSLDAMVRWYQAADLFCFGSLREGCPNTIIEALACGTPVVTTPVGAVPDLVQPGQDGVVFPMSAPAAFARALAEALDTAWDREAIAARGSRRSWSHVADEYCRVFEQALANGRAAP